MSKPFFPIRKGAVVWSRDEREEGRATGTFRPCQMEGCTGIRVGVRWRKDGKITWPCSKGMRLDNTSYQLD